MSKAVDQKRAKAAQKFIAGANEEFKKFIPRDKIESVNVTKCVEKDGAFEINGGISTISPTGKKKTFVYTASVETDAEGVCSLASLQVRDL